MANSQTELVGKTANSSPSAKGRFIGGGGNIAPPPSL